MMIPLLLLSATLAAQAPQDTARLTVTTAVDRALATHPAVAVARAQRDVADAEVGQARATRLPALSLDGAINRFQEPMVVYPLHSLNLQHPPLFDRALSQASVGAAYTLFDFGARSSKVKAAEAGRDAASAVLDAAEQQMAARTLQAYLRVLTAREVLVAEDQRLAALGAELKRSRDRLAAGKTARVDTLRAAAELASATADREQSASTVDVTERDLSRLTDAPVHGVPLAEVRLTAAAMATEADAAQACHAAVPPKGAPDDCGTTAPRYLTNPDVRAASLRFDAAAAAVGAARSTLYPSVQATSAIVDRSNVTGRYLAEWQVGLALSYPLFTGGARESAISRAEATERVAQQQRQLAQLAASQQSDEATATFGSSVARVRALEAAVAQSAEVARITRLARDVGEGTQTDYLIAEANLFRARSSLVQARHAAIGARVELARVLGELSRPWIARSLESLP